MKKLVRSSIVAGFICAVLFCLNDLFDLAVDGPDARAVATGAFIYMLMVVFRCLRVLNGFSGFSGRYFLSIILVVFSSLGIRVLIRLFGLLPTVNTQDLSFGWVLLGALFCAMAVAAVKALYDWYKAVRLAKSE